MDWTFVYLMVFLKIPILLLGWIVWWAIHNVDEEAVTDRQEGDDDGGIGKPAHPRGPKPRPARRGPHPGTPPAPAPARSRSPLRSPSRSKQP
ncbi:hypothetical protein NBH00_22985 [Paraconexibacter antarcticus]|uniref:Uncharacterized protein n=1 Tax=Paraconexibacter antarcticus TaxID=2949664 RepID=A0ABY5DQ92_9ACTN|nr:hypothetical protein [Paraconexibacter antarcticus]UTI64190.1 hypothetical protein NBH00_22985 [Paraconexibacter antarcticus]